MSRENADWGAPGIRGELQRQQIRNHARLYITRTENRDLEETLDTAASVRHQQAHRRRPNLKQTSRLRREGDGRLRAPSCH